jgi:hypothetical protein
MLKYYHRGRWQGGAVRRIEARPEHTWFASPYRLGFTDVGEPKIAFLSSLPSAGTFQIPSREHVECKTCYASTPRPWPTCAIRKKAMYLIRHGPLRGDGANKRTSNIVKSTAVDGTTSVAGHSRWWRISSAHSGGSHVAAAAVVLGG